MDVSNLSTADIADLLGVADPNAKAAVSTPKDGLNKGILERFIAKYNLGGASESVSWVADDNGLTTEFASDDKNVCGFITAKDVKLDHGTYNVFETATLLSLLKVVDETIKIQVKTEKGTPIAFVISDGAAKVTAVLADPRAIPVVPKIKGLPPWDVKINLDPKFTLTYIKAKGALSKSERFTVLSDGSTAEVVLGYEAEHNTNSVNIVVDAPQNGALPATHFDADYLKNILLANKEATSGTMSVSKHGLAHLNFTVEGFVVDYYLVSKK